MTSPGRSPHRDERGTMSSASSDEHRALLSALNESRQHILAAVEGLDDDQLRRPVLPSGWTCLGLVNHLSLDVERFWFQAVIAGDQAAIDEVLGSSADAWRVSADETAKAVLETYRRNIELADAALTSRSLDMALSWWREDFFGSWRIDTVREVVLHVITETATHAGHLDAVRELVDGKLHLVLTD